MFNVGSGIRYPELHRHHRVTIVLPLQSNKKKLIKSLVFSTVKHSPDSLPLRRSHLHLGSVQYLLEFRYPMSHARMHVRL